MEGTGCLPKNSGISPVGSSPITFFGQKEMHHFQIAISGAYHRQSDLNSVGVYVYHVMKS